MNKASRSTWYGDLYVGRVIDGFDGVCELIGALDRLYTDTDRLTMVNDHGP